jgi:alpha-1,6-mannosyltransferase
MLRERDDTESLPAAAAAGQDVRFLTRPRPGGRPALYALGLCGLVAVVASVFAVAAGAAGAPGPLVPGRSGGWTGWLAGPLRGLGLGTGTGGFQVWTLAMCAGYAAVLATVRELPGRAIAVAIVLADLLLLLGPPLLSQDVFGYLAFARLGALHGLDPYTHVAAEAPVDAVFPFIGWPFQHSPYGPLFTLGSYPLGLLGLGGGLWALKAVAVAASLAAVALIARAARAMGRSGKAAAAFVGLNPVLLELAIGGAHNDTLVLLALAGALALMAPTGGGDRSTLSAPSSGDTHNIPPAPRAGAAVFALAGGIGVKASTGLVLPFLVLSEREGRARVRLALRALAALAALALIALAGFGPHAFGFLDAISEQQQLVATHSIPQETARWLGMSGLPGWWRDLFTLAFLAVLALTLWRTATGADWRTMAGWATLALLLCTAWLLPWYAIWALPLAALGDSRRLRAATLAVCAYALLIHLPLADPVLSPPRHLIESSVGAGHRVVFAGLQVGGHAALHLDV